MSTTAEEALSRAKAIAARLSGNGEAGHEGNNASPAGTGTGTTKRKRWGVAPAAVATQDVLPGLSEAAKKAKLGSGTSKKIWIRATPERSVAHFKSYFSERLGRLESEVNAGKDPAEQVQLKLKGRGSSNEPPLPGMPEEPMHILISGSEAAIASVDAPVDSLIGEAEEAPVEAAGEPDNSASPQTNANKNSLALTTMGYNPSTAAGSTSSYRPATVAQLISNNPINAALNSDDLMEETVDVPNGVVGYLIGRGGETISSMQARSGCKIQIQKEHDLTPGQTHRVITLQAATQDSIDQCRGMIESMVQDRIRAAGGNASMGGGGSKDGKVQEALAAGHALVQVQVPDADVGLIIGKAGMTIKSIQDTTGASIQIPPSGNSENPEMRTVSITHPTEEGAKIAKQQIEDVLKSKPSFSQGGGGGSGGVVNSGPQITVQVMIPDRDVGLCIGRQGCVIREMQQKTGTRIQIPSHPTPGQPHRVATVTGSQEGCNQVQALIDRIISEQSSACVMSGTPFDNQNQSYLQQQYYDGGNNNSAEWQAYYAAQAVAKQQGQPEAPAQAAPAAAQAADAYYEQFFRYAYYYGEEPARQYYGAWSPPTGTPNPYGVNPNGVTQPPPAQTSAAASPAPAPTPAPAPAAAPVAPMHHQGARDSSVRKVSNLPAWMTRGT